MISFNPCYNGLLIRTIWQLSDYGNKKGFNPCYNGLLIRTEDGEEE